MCVTKHYLGQTSMSSNAKSVLFQRYTSLQKGFVFDLVPLTLI